MSCFPLASSAPAGILRRTAGQWLGAVALGGLLSGCDQPALGGQAAVFNGIDITGAPCAQGFALTDFNDQPRTLADFRGQVMLYFGFVQCPDVCPTVLLREYKAAFDPSFLALTGSATQIKAAADEFRVFYKKVPTGSSCTMDHTALSHLFDREGNIRVALRHEQTADAPAADIRNC